MSTRTFRIVSGDCCGQHCMDLYLAGDHFTKLAKGFPDDDKATEAMRYHEDDTEEEHAEWAMRLSAVKDAIRHALRDRKITQEEADQILADWLEDNPEPGVPEEEPINVTEEFERSQPVRIEVAETHEEVAPQKS